MQHGAYQLAVNQIVVTEQNSPVFHAHLPYG